MKNDDDLGKTRRKMSQQRNFLSRNNPPWKSFKLKYIKKTKEIFRWPSSAGTLCIYYLGLIDLFLFWITNIRYVSIIYFFLSSINNSFKRLCSCYALVDRTVCCLYILSFVCNRTGNKTQICELSRMSRSTQVLKIQQRFKGTLFINIEVDLPWNDQRQDTCAASRSISMSSTLFCPPVTNDLTVLSFIFPFLSFCCFQNEPIYWESCRISRPIFHSILV